ncbi:hypothetical protein CDAR_228451 [Caerostris darwini]|uniref:Uncharacterized protein n=1 Tax=Caerostris darwini TaxID=1538125 RepID=A0AAV4N3W6_9ARAC|nr:hypothetical protein CDAR_228451 [Caerostris darwini]
MENLEKEDLEEITFVSFRPRDSRIQLIDSTYCTCASSLQHVGLGGCARIGVRHSLKNIARPSLIHLCYSTHRDSAPTTTIYLYLARYLHNMRNRSNSDKTRTEKSCFGHFKDECATLQVEREAKKLRI